MGLNPVKICQYHEPNFFVNCHIPWCHIITLYPCFLRTSVSFRFFETGWLTSLSLTVTNLKSSARWPAVNCEISGPYKSLIESQRCQSKARRHNCTTCNINKLQDTLRNNPQGLGTHVCQVPCSQTNAARATCSSYNRFQLEFPQGKKILEFRDAFFWSQIWRPSKFIIPHKLLYLEYVLKHLAKKEQKKDPSVGYTFFCWALGNSWGPAGSRFSPAQHPNLLPGSPAFQEKCVKKSHELPTSLGFPRQIGT